MRACYEKGENAAEMNPGAYKRSDEKDLLMTFGGLANGVDHELLGMVKNLCTGCGVYRGCECENEKEM